MDKKIIVEIKVVDFMPKVYEDQFYTYLKGTDYKLGYFVNFGFAEIDVRGRVYDRARINEN